MALSKLAANSFDLTDNYAFTGTTTGVTSTQKLFLIKNLDASSSSTLSFVDGSDSVTLDNTYKTYYFKFINIHPATDGAEFQFQGNAVGGSGFNETITSAHSNALHNESSGATELTYETNHDLAQSTNFKTITRDIGNGNDECTSGELFLFDPSSTTFVKHFLSRANTYHNSDFTEDSFTAGYFNTTSAIDEIQFKFSSGNIDSGTIEMYGIN